MSRPSNNLRILGVVGGIVLSALTIGAIGQTIPAGGIVPLASSSVPGKMKCDGVTTTCAADGTVTATAGGSAGINQLTGDVAAGPASGSAVATLATVNGGSGVVGSSTAIPVLTTNAKGLVTAQTTAVVVAPAGTLTGATLAAGVTASSLTSTGTLVGGATGAGFTLNLGTSTISGNLPSANLTGAYTAITNLTASGAITFSGLGGGGTLCVHASNTGVLSTAAADCGTGGGGLTVGTSTITSGTTTRVLFDNAGVLGEYTISGTGNVAMTTNGVFTTPNLGTPSALVLTNATGTPSAITLTNGTGLPVAGITGLGTGVATALGTAVSGSGAICLASGSACSGGATNLTVGTSTVTSGTTTRVLFDNAGIVGEYVISGTGNVAMTTNGVFTTPNLGTPSAAVLTNATGLPLAGMANLAANSIIGNNTGSPATPIALTTAQTKTLLAIACADLTNAAASCATDATNASNISTGTLAAARGGAGTINGILKANGSGVVSLAAAGSDYQAPTTITASTANIVIGGTSTAPTVGSTAAANVQSGASYTIVAGDSTKVVERTNASLSQTDTLPNVSATGFGAGFGYTECSGPVASAQQVTITPNSPSTINGLSSIVLPANTCVSIADPDGTNYVAHYGGVLSVANSDATLTVSPIAGSVIVSLNLAHANSWSANQTFTNVLNTNGNGFELVTGAASATVPTLVPNQSAATTGFGAQASGNISTIIAGTEIGRWVAGGLTMQTGKEITTAASATGGSGFNLPHGTAPTSPVNGDCWTTTAGLFCQINGSTVGPFGTGAGGGNVNAGGTLTSNAIVLGAGSQNVAALGSLGTTTTILHGNAAGAPSFGAVSLTADVSGVLPVANGGTNIASYTTGDVLYASGATTVAKLADVATGQVLHSGGVGVAPAYSAIVTADLPGSGATTVNGQTCTLNSTCTVWHVAGGAQLSGPSAVTTTLYDAVLGNSYGGLATTLDAQSRNLWPLTETLGKLNAEITTAPGTGKSVTFTIFVNGSTSGITCTISNAATSCADDVHTASVTEGQAVALQMSFSGTPANPGASNFAFAGHQ